MRLRWVLVGAGILAACLAACEADFAKNPAPRCDADGGCPSGGTCYRGFCVPGPGGECEEEGLQVDCYTGEEGTAGVGVCRPGRRLCDGGSFGACLGQIVPGVEVCGGGDQDCDGRIDETVGVSCDTGMDGVCGEGELLCQGTTATCMPVADRVAEVCNGRDDDCDAETDEHTAQECYPDGAEGCVLGDDGYTCHGVCGPGDRQCTDGALGACAGATLPTDGPDGCTAAGSTAVDDDCDGATDEDCACTPGETQSCYSGPAGTEGVGACRAGTQTCETRTDGTARYGDCVGAVMPVPETCANDGVDDDCNGAVDDVRGRSEPCTDAAAMGRCRVGVTRCVDGGLACVTPEPVAETCNEVDDDCDGGIDEDFDLLSDPAHCGACGATCAEGLSCCNGACVDLSSASSDCGACGEACGEGLGCCGGSCFDLETDEAACGGCGIRCGADQRCCGGECVDPRSDLAHCGGCGVTCGSSAECCDGTCSAPTGPACTGCPTDCAAEGRTCCSGACVDTAASTTHCGGCGIACSAGELCCDGSCEPRGTDHCGGCGIACAAGELCCGGACVPGDESNCGGCGIVCAGGSECCGGTCRDLASDESSCGGCGVTCAAGEECVDGLCCASGQEACGSACVDVLTDEANCGACGRVCEAGLWCEDGCCCNPGRCFC